MNYFHFEPVKFLSALLAFGVAVITGLALWLDWTSDTVLAVNAIWAAFITLFGTFFTSNQAVSVKGLEALAAVDPPA